jgi:hypothetical protein
MNPLLEVLVGFLGWGIGPSLGLYLQRTTQQRDAPEPGVEIETTTPVFERCKTIILTLCEILVLG